MQTTHCCMAEDALLMATLILCNIQIDVQYIVVTDILNIV